MLSDRDGHGGASPQQWAGRLFLAPGWVLYLGPGASAEAHRHHAVQFVWAPARPLSLTLRGSRLVAHAALIPANVEHSLAANGEPLALMLVERHGARGTALHRIALERAGEDLSAGLRGIELPARAVTAASAMAWCDTITGALGAAGAGGAPSEAVTRGIAYIDSAMDRQPRLDAAAASASLSPTRFTHRFSTEVGIPFRRFVQWARIKRAVEAVRRGANLTDAAAAAGFSDSAHLSRTFRSMFGHSPSTILPLMEFAGSLWAREDDSWPSG